jgi:hypothetical protein
MEIDWNAVRARFAGMTQDELLDEAALRADDYSPLAQRILEGEALARGITAAQIEAKRGAAAPPVVEDSIELPALITSADDKSHVREMVGILRERGIPALCRELDPKAFHGSGHRVGRWGLMVAGRQAADAARLLESTLPPAAEEDAADGCGGGCCSAGGECEPSAEEWPEDGDWWQSVPGEEEPQGGQR